MYDKEEMIEEIPMGRIGTVGDIVNTMEFLASDKADYITGQIIGVNGGQVI
jgi:NAD(P)-dependent dehydrogenase (short-subunit alcohol dehydrogenase family)